jgi:hypothetical protein
MSALIAGRSAAVAGRGLTGPGVVSGGGGTGRLYRPVAFWHLDVKTRGPADTNDLGIRQTLMDANGDKAQVADIAVRRGHVC